MIEFHADPGAGDWIKSRLRPGEGTAEAIVPRGFESYARIFHPAYAPDGARLTWADVAAGRGNSMPSLVQFAAIAGLPASGYRGVDDVTSFSGSAPLRGELEPEKLAALAGILESHTPERATCYFGLWDGYAWINAGQAEPQFSVRGDRLTDDQEAALQTWEEQARRPAFARRVLSAPRLSLPGRSYLLFTGGLPDLRQPPWRAFHPFAGGQSPNLLWPADHGWCVGTDIDIDSTVVGGSSALIAAIIRSFDLEAATVAPEDVLFPPGDRINRS